MNGSRRRSTPVVIPAFAAFEQSADPPIMQAVVTGATGFLGQRLVRSLCEDGWAVRCLVRPSSDIAPLRAALGDLWHRVEVDRADLSRRDECRSAISRGDVVFHLAAGLTGSPSTLFLNTVIPTRRLVEAAAEADVRRFVLVSSLAVYATARLRSGTLVTEETPLEPMPHLRDAYTYSKVVQEQAARTAAERDGLPLVVVRPGVICGPGRGILSSRVGVQLGDLLIRMGGRQVLPYTYVDNCAAALAKAGLAPHLDGHAVNVVDDDLPTAAGLLRMLAAVGRKPKSLWVPGMCIGLLSGLFEICHRRSRGQIPGVITRYRSASMWKPLRYSNAKAKQLLSWSPEVPFREAFARSLGLEIPAA